MVFEIKHSEIQVKLVARLMFIFLGIILALHVSQYAIYLVAGLVLYAISQKRVEFTFFALMLLVSLAIMNPVFFTKGFSFYLVTRVSLLVLAIMMTAKAGFLRSAWFLSPFVWLYAYMGYIMVASLAGWAPVISELKAVLFLIFMLALTQSVSAVVLSGFDNRAVRAAMLVVSCFYILGSVLSIPFPSIGRSMVLMQAEGWGQSLISSEMNGLFNGVTWHSQALGPTVATLNAFVLSDYLCNFKNRSRLYWLLLLSVPVLVYMTSSRTALFAYLISVFASVFFFMRERQVSAAKKSKVLMNLIFFALAAVLILAMRPGGFASVEGFLRKTQETGQIDRSDSLTESIMKSRMGLVEQGMANFRASPMIGNGFQVSEEMKEYSFSESGMILTAPIEKGVLPVMVLEEGGIFGAILMIAFVIAVYEKYSRLRFTCFLSTFTVYLGLNSGEAAFFSTSGGGGILWMICFCGLLMDVHRHRRLLSDKQTQQVTASFRRCV